MSVTVEPAVWVSGLALNSSTECELCGPSHDEIEVTTTDFATFDVTVSTGCYGGSHVSGPADTVLADVFRDHGHVAGVDRAVTALRAVVDPSVDASLDPWRAQTMRQGATRDDVTYVDLVTADRRQFDLRVETHTGRGEPPVTWTLSGDATTVLTGLQEAFPEGCLDEDLAGALTAAALG